MARMVKNMPAMQETCVRSLGWEDPLEKEMATHSGILAWEIAWTEEPGRLQSMGWQTTANNIHQPRCPCFLNGDNYIANLKFTTKRYS